jgi:putative sigma-54 modulation protein
VQVKISTRHGALQPAEQAHLQDKAEKLLKYFGRLMAIEVEAEHRKNDWQVDLFVSAEHKHDFVAREQAPTPEAAMDLCVHKIEHQLRKYKDKIQNRKGGVPHGGLSPVRDSLGEPPADSGASDASSG